MKKRCSVQQSSDILNELGKLEEMKTEKEIRRRKITVHKRESRSKKRAQRVAVVLIGGEKY